MNTNPNTKKLTKKFLNEEYVIKRKTAKTIAKQNNVTMDIVYYWIKKYKLPIRVSGPQTSLSDMIGKKSGKLTVIARDSRKDRDSYWLCECECGNTTVVRRSHLKDISTRSCGCLKKEVHFKGYKDISMSYWTQIVNGAKRRNLDVKINIEDIWELFVLQDGRCALTGIPITLSRNANITKPTASLDRIDSSKGYVPGNIQWVHKTINVMKLDLSENEFLEWCKLVVQHHE